MSEGAPKRRLRVRRKRKGSKVAEDIAAGADVEVVAEAGCCLVEAVTAATVVVGLVVLPAFLFPV